jgi:predicted ATPase/DNA-binding SARP family transcriptional activator
MAGCEPAMVLRPTMGRAGRRPVNAGSTRVNSFTGGAHEVRGDVTALDIGVLGELTVARDGCAVAITGPGRRALLGLLAANAGRVVSVEGIVEGLWGETPPTSAVKVVQTHISQLRRALEPDRDGAWQVLVTHPSGYTLASGPETVDAARFEAAVQAASELSVAESVDPLRDALALWRGPPYAGIDRPFVTPEAARLEHLRLSCLTRCLAGELARGRHREVESELRALAAEHPLDEAVAELVMLALYRSGQQAEALRVHSDLRRRLAEELGTDPGPAIARLHERMMRHHPALDPATPTAADADAETPSRLKRAVGNLPPPRTSFIGRRSEILAVAAMTRDHRLTTLLGAGGAGKTRLALRAATEVAADFDGVWLVALGTLDDDVHLAGHCLTEVGLIDQMDREPLKTLHGWIADRHLLLVLDNCEHLADAVAELVDQLLGACPRLHVLATSRQPLRCPGETQWRVPTLSVPSTPEVEDVATSESGSLFVARATDARPDFQLDAATAPAVQRICRRLDGIPLAIELAAVRMATMSAADLAAGLDDRFQLLTSGNRTALPRHRTLLATTDWSYDLLSAEQQRLLCRLSTFVAGFGTDAAAEICGWEPLEPRSVPGLLADLADHSLTEAHEVDGHTRYRLLETVREYGRERLADDVEETAYRYGQWVARMVEAVGANAQLDTPTWYGLLDEEFLHLQGAFAAAMRRQDAETALRIASGSGWALIIIGRFHRLREWLREALALARETDIDDRVLAQGLMMGGAVAGIDHRFEGTLDLLSEARQRFDAAGHVEGMLWTGYWQAATLGEMGELEAALPEIAHTADEAASNGLEIVEANCRAEQAELIVAAALAAGGPDPDALADSRRALARARRLAETNGMKELSARVGFTEVVLTALGGQPKAALAQAGQRLQVWRAFGRGNRLILALVATAKIALLADRPADARPLVAEAVKLIGEAAWPGPLRGAAQVLAELSETHDSEAAATLLGAADARPPTHRWRMYTELTGVRTRLEDALGREAFAVLHAKGRTLDLDEIVALASAIEATPNDRP